VSVPIRLVLVDDHPIVLQGLEQLFGFEPDMEVVARCLSAQQALSAMEEHRPDVLVLDIRMPDEDGLAVLRELHTRRIRTRVILLTAAVDEDEVVAGLRNKEIATRLTISESTVKIHLHNTYEKLRVDGRLELMLLAQEHGLV
jgi:DNA-binding NarL/FixJ family response regulator